MGARARWAVPAGVVAVVGVVIGATAVANAAAPSLPARSVGQLLADVQQGSANPLGPLTATVQETASLGLPALPQIGQISGQGGDLGALSPLAGTTTISIWYLNQRHFRVAQQVQMGETDLRVDGTQLWLWDSKSQTATHVLLPRDLSNGSHSAAQAPSSASANSSTSTFVATPTPQQAARQLLKLLGPSTRVTLGPNVTVAGRNAYQISVAPKASGSLVSQILIAIDAARHIPLRVEVIARGSSSPALEIGYTALTFGAPAMSNFSFTPPPGAHVKTVTVPAKVPAGLNGRLGLPGLGLGALSLGALGLGGPGVGLPAGHLQVRLSCQSTSSAKCPPLPKGFRPGGPMKLPKAALKQIEASFAAHLPKSMSKAQRAAAIKAFDKQITAGMMGNPNNGGGFFNVRPLHSARAVGKAKAILRARARAGLVHGWAAPISGTGSPKVMGKDWTSVVVTPANPNVAAAVKQLLATPRGQHSSFGMLGGSSSQQAPGPNGAAGPVPIGPDLAVLRAVLEASKPVSGSWGRGRLLTTALLSVLVTSKGQILAGAVTPSVLYADAATASK
jgi:outer membrane lipoprotein-sorting protein